MQSRKENMGMSLEKKRFTRVTGDFLLNIIASVVYNFARQIVVFPLLASRLSDTDYGTLLTVVGLVNVCNALVGVSLNNIRLVQNSKYEEQNIKGDFLLLCTGGSVLSIVFVALLSVVFKLSWITGVLLCLYVCANNYYQYAIAHFRIALDFKRNLIVNCLMSVAYVPAALLFANAVLWPAVFLIGDGVGLIYTAVKTQFHREPLVRTPLMGETLRKVLALALVSVVSNLLLYADRMIIYPVLGGENVSYYSTASFFGKSAGIIMVPIAGVLLSYFSQKGFQASKKLYALINGICLVCLAVFMAGCWLFAPWFTRLLYPTLYEQSEPYIMLANLGAVINIAGNMAQPMILKCCSTKWLVASQLLYGVVYVIAAAILLPAAGLMGFCWATILANTIRLLSLYLIGFIKFS